MSPLEDGITREELKLMMEVQSKATEQMVLVADRLKEIVDDQKQALENHNKILTELSGVKSNEIGVKESANKIELVVDTMKNDILHAKWFIAVISLLIIVVTVILRGIDNRLLFNKNQEKIVEETRVSNEEMKAINEIKKILLEKDINGMQK